MWLPQSQSKPIAFACAEGMSRRYLRDGANSRKDMRRAWQVRIPMATSGGHRASCRCASQRWPGVTHRRASERCPALPLMSCNGPQAPRATSAACTWRALATNLVTCLLHRRELQHVHLGDNQADSFRPSVWPELHRGMQPQSAWRRSALGRRAPQSILGPYPSLRSVIGKPRMRRSLLLLPGTPPWPWRCPASCA